MHFSGLMLCVLFHDIHIVCQISVVHSCKTTAKLFKITQSHKNQNISVDIIVL